MLDHETTARICWGAAGRLLGHWGYDFGDWDDLVPIARHALTVITQYAGDVPEEMHARWCGVMREAGWTYEPERDYERQTHPWICPWRWLDEGARLFFKMWRHIVIFLALEYPEGGDFAHGLQPRRLPAT